MKNNAFAIVSPKPDEFRDLEFDLREKEMNFFLDDCGRIPLALSSTSPQRPKVLSRMEAPKNELDDLLCIHGDPLQLNDPFIRDFWMKKDPTFQKTEPLLGQTRRCDRIHDPAKPTP
jgi:hypothetical protein